MQIIALSFALLCLPTSGTAQTPQQNALARSLFEDGVRLADQSDWVGAADRFSRAYSLKPTSGVAFNWASVLVESGQLLQAQELLLSVLRDGTADPQLKADSQVRLTALAPRIARLRIHVTGTVDERTTVELDSIAWPRAAWDIASPIDPGPHSVLLKLGADEAARSELTLAEGELRELTLEPTQHAATQVLTAQPASSQRETHQTPLYKNWMVWTAVGVVVVAGVITGVVLSTGKSSKEAAPVAGNAMPGVLRW